MVDTQIYNDQHEALIVYTVYFFNYLCTKKYMFVEILTVNSFFVSFLFRNKQILQGGLNQNQIVQNLR